MPRGQLSRSKSVGEADTRIDPGSLQNLRRMLRGGRGGHDDAPDPANQAGLLPQGQGPGAALDRPVVPGQQPTVTVQMLQQPTTVSSGPAATTHLQQGPISSGGVPPQGAPAGGEPDHLTPEDIQTVDRLASHPLGSILFSVVGHFNELLSNQIGIPNVAKPIDVVSVAKRFNDVVSDEISLRQDVNQLNYDTRQDRAALGSTQQTIDELSQMAYKRNFNIGPLLEDTVNNPLYAIPVDAPTRFAAEGSTLTSSDLNTVLKILPRHNNRFSGEKSHALDVRAFLSLMRTIPDTINISETEFKKHLVSACQGRAFTFVNNWVDRGYSVKSIYNQLFSTFNNQESASSAQEKLNNFKARKNKTSAEIEATIGELAIRASEAIPKGVARDVWCEHYAAKTYIKCLPDTISAFVEGKYNDLASISGGQPSYGDFLQYLTPHRARIDLEIRTHGAIPPKKGGGQQNFGRQSGSYNVREVKMLDQSDSQESHSICFSQSSGGGRGRGAGRGHGPARGGLGQGGAPGGQRGRGRGGPQRGGRGASRGGRGGGLGGQSSDYQAQSSYQPPDQRGDTNSGSVKSGGPAVLNWTSARKPRNWPDTWEEPLIKEKGARSAKYCTLCGETSHFAHEGCYNMRLNTGERVLAQPCYGYCKQCNKNLLHPEHLCPWRAELCKDKK